METNYAIIQIQRYLRGELSQEEMHALEREALEDPFLQEAFDGYSAYEDVPHGHLSLLQQRLVARTQQKKLERDHFFFGSQRLSVAAAAAVLFLLVCTLYLMRAQFFNSSSPEKSVEVELKQGSVSAIAIGVSLSQVEGYDAIPEKGWEDFQSYLKNQKFMTSMTGTYQIYFGIDEQGLPTQVLLKEANPGLRKEMEGVLRKGPKWKGEKGSFQITLDPQP
jgi:hypothetical protein